jgi:hypothetical protein
MDARICNFKVYLRETVEGRRVGWSFHRPLGDKDGADKIVMEMILWNLLYAENDGAKLPNGKSVVTKTDLYWLLEELAIIGGLEEIAAAN